MIPKIVHYIWFGGKPYPEKIRYCIDSWKKYLPGYEFMLWNENSFDVNSVPFTKQAFEHKKWAFVSDYVRVYALYKYGGWYLDTDNEICKPLTPFENHRMVLGTDDDGALTALMGSERGHELWRKILNYYETMDFVREDGSLNMTVNNKYIEKLLFAYGFENKNIYQTLQGGIEVYPDDYFHVVSFLTQKHHRTKNTYAIHWHTNLWLPKSSRFKRFIREKILSPIIGAKNSANCFMLFNKLIRKK